MSDFFGDDFTAELKSYFLNSVIHGVDNFIDLIDAKIWKRICNEASEQTQAWSIDAKTNEFEFFATWLNDFDTRTRDFSESTDLSKALQALKSYATALLAGENDSLDLSRRFSQVAQNSHEVLFLHCKSGPQEFAVPLLNVIEISAHLPLYGLPEKRFGILGVVPFRGDALPVVNLQDHGFRSLAESENIFYLICEHAQNRFCLQVTATEDLLNLKESDLQEVEEQNIFSAELIKKFFIHQSRSVMILDLEKLVAS